MNLNKFNDDARMLLSRYGREHQIEKAIEECIECAEALQELLDYSEKVHAVEEVADCSLMMLQMCSHLGAAEVEAMIQQKIERQKGRIENGH